MALRVMEEREMAEPIVQILPLLPCVRKKGYKSGIEMKKGNRVRDSAGVRQEEGESKGRVAKERKNKGISSLDEIQHLSYRYLVYVLNHSLDGPNARMGRARSLDSLSSERDWPK